MGDGSVVTEHGRALKHATVGVTLRLSPMTCRAAYGSLVPLRRSRQLPT